MCIIALDNRTESTERIPEKVLRRCQEKYSDGMGIMWGTGRELITWRTMDDFRGLWNRYTTARDRQARVALHFRLTTKGGNSLDNCHPFRIDGRDLAFMHNGTISKFNDYLPDGVSDSRWVRDEIFDYMPSGFLNRDGLYAMVEEIAGRSRLLFMDAEGNYSIFNEHVGFWWPTNKREVWFSHTRDRSFLITGSEGRGSGSIWRGGHRGSHHRMRRDNGELWCVHCSEYTSHYGIDCPDEYPEKAKGSDEDDDHEAEANGYTMFCIFCEDGGHTADECPYIAQERDFNDDACLWCGEEHYKNTPCDLYTDENQCILCGAIGGHANMLHCGEFNPICEVCTGVIEHGQAQFSDGVLSHKKCEVRICTRCDMIIEKGHTIAISGAGSGDQTYSHVTCPAEPDDIEPPFNKSTAPELDSDKLETFELDDGVELQAQKLPGQDIVTSGMYYFGVPYCIACLSDYVMETGDYNPHNAFPIPQARRVEITCGGCGLVLHQPESADAS